MMQALAAACGRQQPHADSLRAAAGQQGGRQQKGCSRNGLQQPSLSQRQALK